MFKMRRHTQVILMRFIAIFMFIVTVTVSTIAIYASVPSSDYEAEQENDEGSDQNKEEGSDDDASQEEGSTPVVISDVSPAADPVESPTDDGTPDETPNETPGETPDETPSETPGETPDETPSETPDETPSETPDGTPSTSPDATPDVSPSASPSATPSATPDTADEDSASIWYSSKGISGTGLDEVTVSFDTSELNEEDTFDLVLSVDAEDVSSNHSFTSSGDGCYEISGLGKDARDITFGNLNGEEFSISAKGDAAAFDYYAFDEVSETEAGYAGKAEITVVSEEAEAEEPETEEEELTEQKIITKTDDGAWITVGGLLPEGATVNAVPVSVEIEGKVVLAAYDITILDADGAEYQITESVTVSITTSALKEANNDKVSIYHMEDTDSVAQKVADVEINYDKVSFEAEGFSIYAAAEDDYSTQVGTGDAICINDPDNDVTWSVNVTNPENLEGVGRNTVFTFRLNYSFNNTVIKPSEDNNVAYFIIPSELVQLTTSSGVSGTIYHEHDAIGSYKLSGNYVTFTYDKNWLHDNQNNVEGFFEFRAEVDTSYTENKDTVIISFPGSSDDITITFDDGDVKGYKDYELLPDGTIEFTVTFEVEGKDAENVVLTDKIGSVFTFVSDSFYLDDAKADVVINGQEAVINISNLAIGEHQLKYRATINKDVLADASNEHYNEIQWDWDNNPSDDPHSAYRWVGFSQESIGKSGTQEQSRIKWTITVKPDSLSNVIGQTVTDKLGSNQRYEGTFNVYKGYSYEWGNDPVDTVTLSEGATEFTYTFSEANIGTAEIGQTYTIEYYSIPDQVDVDGTYTNSLNGEEYEVNYTEANSGTCVDIVTKNGSASNYPDSTITWTITVDPTKYTDGQKITNLELHDQLLNAATTGSVYDQTSLSVQYDNGTALVAGTDYTITWNDADFIIKFKDSAIDMTKRIVVSYTTKLADGSSEDGNKVEKNCVKTTYNLDGKTKEETDDKEIEYAKKASKPFEKSGVLDGNEVEWTIVANRSEWVMNDDCKEQLKGSYAISDQLPEGMEYIENSASYDLRRKGSWGSGSIEPTIGADGKLTFTFDETFSETDATYNGGWVYIVLTFRTRITSMPENDSASFINHAQFIENGEEIGSASAEVTIENTALDKTGVLNETDLNTVNYTIIVNRAGADLNPYSDVLTLVDTLDPNTTLDLSSVSVTELSTGKAVDYTFSYDSTGGQDKFALELPDKMTLKVAYEVVVAGEKNTTVTIRNSAELSGIANASTTEENQVTIQESSAGAEADPGSITICKYDSDTLQPISGAVFSLYKLNQENGTGNFMMDSVAAVEESQEVGAKGKLTFSNLDADVVYYYVEETAPSGYVLDTEKHYFILQGNSYEAALAKMSPELKNLINKWPGGKSVNVFNSPVKIDISGTKLWVDNENQDGIRPGSIMVHLLKNNTEIVSSTLVTASNGWNYTFKNLPEYENGQKITYTVQEETVDGYTASYPEGGYDIINTHTPATVTISGTKEWKDNSNQDGKRPGSITIKLYKTLADGSKELVKSKSVNGTGDSWSWSFENLPKYDHGTEIVYTVEEEQVEGYEEPKITGNAKDGYTITNTHTPEKITISGTKKWVDNGDDDSDRKAEITVNLYKNGGTTPFKSTTTSAADNWEWSFTELDKYENGTEITYTIQESPVTDYTTNITQDEETKEYVIINTHKPGETSRTVQKVWNDSDNQDGKRPDSIKVQLYANGAAYGDPVDLSGQGNEWSYTWDSLPERGTDGKTITYTVKEIREGSEKWTSDYGTSYSTDTFVITNTHETETTDIKGTKVWEDNSNQDGKRPTSITVELYADGGTTAIASTTVTGNEGSDNWSWSFTDLPKYRDQGTAIQYTVKEVVDEDTAKAYTSQVDGYTITNTHTPETINISGSKTWLDDGENDRPESITINLYKESSNVAVKTVTVTKEDNWKWSFTDLAKYENGTKIEYYITEDSLTDYSSKITGNAADGFVVTNTHTPGETSRTVMKVWKDGNNQDGLRRDSITVQLLADGNAYGDSVTLSDSNNWQATWEKLPERGADGKTITYTVEEIGKITGYETSYSYNKDESTFVITNAHTPETIRIDGTKVWEDNSNQDGKRPTSITVELYADGGTTAIASTTVTGNEGSDSWSWSFTNLPKYRDKGTAIQYTVKEVVDEATAKAYTSEIDGFTITNTHVPEKTKVEGSKTWVDDGEDDRPTSITINLYANGTFKDSKAVTASDGWKWSFTNLDKYANGSEIKYTITEDKVDNYSAKIDGYNVTNTHTPGETSITVQKVWNDNNDQDGKRPKEIYVQLYANGVASGDPVTLSGTENTWTYTWTELPARENGKTITYTVKEITGENDKWVDDYKTSYSDDTFTITNAHTPETTSISGTKTWDDNNNQDGKRPGSITINLLVDKDVVRSQIVTPDNNGIWSYEFTNLPVYKDGSAIDYRIEEVITDRVAAAAYTPEVSDYDVKNTHTPEETKITVKKVWEDTNNQDGKRPTGVVVTLLANGTATGTTVTLNEGNDWKHTFTGLPKYENGSEISYSVSEGTVTDYSSDIKKTENETEGVVYTITNSYTPGKTTISVEKRWSDNNDQDGKRPTEIQVQLKADNVDKGSPVILNAANNWSYTWTDLAQMAEGKAITYTVKEVSVPAGYNEQPDYTVNGNKITITNIHTPATIDISGTKTWEDNNNQDGKRPTSITIKLLKNGAEYKSQTVTPDTDGNWKYSFTGLPEYEGGSQISYSIQEVTNATAAGYTSKVDGYDVTNTYTPEKTEVSVQKVWDDESNQDGKRPPAVEVTLLADGEEQETVTLNANNGWKHTFTNLDKYSGGNLISYTVSEETVDSYSAKITGNATSGYTITNSYTPAKTSISVEKVWDDANDQDGKRPASIQVQLYADNTAKGDPITLDSTNNWRYTWNELAQKSGGNDIRYEVKEVRVPDGYTVNPTVSGIKTTITNSYSPATTSVSVNKEWSDANNQDGKRPASITIKLLKDGAEYQSQVVEADASGNWSYTFENLPKYRDQGTEIVYTVQEVKVEGYNDPVVTGNAANGFTITNTHTPETVAVEGTKTWVDNGNAAGARPASITINLLADGKKIDSQTIKPDASGSWPSWKFENLPKYAEGSVGKEIKYTISEDDVTDYTATVEVDSYNVTNTYTPETTMVTVTKKWVDNENADGLRPEAIWVQLYKDKLIDTAVGDPVRLSAENGWSCTWNDLPKRGFLLTINYTVKELGVEDADGKYVAVTGYTSATSETTTNNIVITNTLTTLPTPTPGETPAPTGTPDTTPETTPDTTPEATPDVTPGTTPEVTPSATPGTTPEATPNATPEATPNSTPTVDRTPAPTATPTREVLGAFRVKDQNVAVLGARRGLDYAVLGKRRRPSTGDSTAMLWWILTLGFAAGTALSSAMLLHLKKEE